MKYRITQHSVTEKWRVECRPWWWPFWYWDNLLLYVAGCCRRCYDSQAEAKIALREELRQEAYRERAKAGHWR